MIKNLAKMCREAYVSGERLSVFVALDVGTGTASRLVTLAGGAPSDAARLSAQAHGTTTVSICMDVTGSEDKLFVPISNGVFAVRGSPLPLRVTGHALSPTLTVFLPAELPLMIVQLFVQYVQTGKL